MPMFSVMAAGIVGYSVNTTSLGIGDGVGYRLSFLTPSGLDAGETIAVTFASEFDISSITYEDVDIEINSVGQPVAALASGTMWGVNISSNVITFTSNTATIPAGGSIVIEIGKFMANCAENLVVNPSVGGNYTIDVAGTFGDIGSRSVQVVGTVQGINVEGNVTPVPVCVQDGGNTSATVQWAVPESRSGALGTNYDTDFYLTVRTSTNSDDVVLFTQPSLATLASDGTYLVPIDFTGITAGTYDIGLKGKSHITKVLQDVVLNEGNNILNFTQSNNSGTFGTQTLFAGDINGVGLSPTTLGDDAINSVDLSLMLPDLDADDPTGNAFRSNLNQDTIVNSIDLSLLLANLDLTGDN